jgi:hypothetical protein
MIYIDIDISPSVFDFPSAPPPCAQRRFSFGYTHTHTHTHTHTLYNGYVYAHTCVCIYTFFVNIQIDSQETRKRGGKRKNLVVYQRLELDGRIDSHAINDNGVDEVRQVMSPLVCQYL